MRRLSTQADDDDDDEGNDRIIVDGDDDDDDEHNIEIRDFDTQFLVDRVVPVGNGYLLLNLPNAITNKRRNSIQMTPPRTKLAKPKTASTMVILAALYILLTHICSDYYLLPSCQSRRSNAFSRLLVDKNRNS